MLSVLWIIPLCLYLKIVFVSIGGLTWRQDFMGNLICVGYLDEVFNNFYALLILQIKVQYITADLIYQR